MRWLRDLNLQPTTDTGKSESDGILYPPEGFKFGTCVSLRNALRLKFGETGDIRYEELNQKLKHISDAMKLSIRDYALKEQVNAHGVTIEIPILFSKQPHSIQMKMFDTGHKVCETLRLCVDDWVLRHLCRTKIEDTRKNMRRYREKEKPNEKNARQSHPLKSEIPGTIVSHSLGDRHNLCNSPRSTSSNVCSPIVASVQTADFISIHESPLLHSDDCANVIATEPIDSVETSILISSESPPQESRPKRPRVTNNSSDMIVLDCSSSFEPDETRYNDWSDPFADEYEKEVIPSSRTLQSKSPRTETYIESCENERPQVKKTKMLEIQSSEEENSGMIADKSAKRNDIQYRKARVATETPVKHTLECAPGWRWHIEISKPFATDNSPYTFQCWKVKIPPE
ncbi:hypothetical protein K3495_g1685 [Podosphaera aphanis]|nr:hypothetical protein K3495_g1685 [Podosphaera aphanis]